MMNTISKFFNEKIGQTILLIFILYVFIEGANLAYNNEVNKPIMDQWPWLVVTIKMAKYFFIAFLDFLAGNKTWNVVMKAREDGKIDQSEWKQIALSMGMMTFVSFCIVFIYFMGNGNIKPFDVSIFSILSIKVTEDVITTLTLIFFSPILSLLGPFLVDIEKKSATPATVSKPTKPTTPSTSSSSTTKPTTGFGGIGF